jgi:hypothetical protein
MLIGSNQDVMSPNRSIFKSHLKSTLTWRKQLYNQSSLPRKSVPLWSPEMQFIFHNSLPLNTILNQLSHSHPILVHFDKSFPIYACISIPISPMWLHASSYHPPWFCPNIGWRVQFLKLLFLLLLMPFFSDPNILLSTLFWYTLSLCSSLRLMKISQPFTQQIQLL